MSDRPRNPSRSGLFSDANPPERSLGEGRDLQTEPSQGTRHPASPPPIDDEAKQFARTLRGLIQSLPRGPGSAPTGATAPAYDGIFGIVAPAFEDQPADDRRAESGRDNQEGDSISQGTGRPDSATQDRHESDTSTRPDLGSGDRPDAVAAIPSAVPPPGGHEGDLSGHPVSDRSREPAGGSVVGPASTGVQIGSFAAEVTSTGIAAAVEPHAALGPAGFPLDRASAEAAAQDDGAGLAATSETVAIGPIGPAGRPEETFDRGPAQAVSATTWGGSLDGDPFGGYLGSASSAGEAQGGADLNQTNALLGQILDELRRYQQQAPIASGRSVYPER